MDEFGDHLMHGLEGRRGVYRQACTRYNTHVYIYELCPWARSRRSSVLCCIDLPCGAFTKTADVDCYSGMSTLYRYRRAECRDNRK